MTQITEIFRQVSPEEVELRQEINLLEIEARKMRKQLAVDKERWDKALKRQQQQGPGPDEVELCTEWIDDKVEQQLAAIRVKEQRIIQIKAEIQKAAKVMSQQLPLF